MALLAIGVRGRLSGGLVIGLIYPQSPESHLHQLTTVIAAQSAVWEVFLFGSIVILTSWCFPPATHLNEAPKTAETRYVCCGFLVFLLQRFAAFDNTVDLCVSFEHTWGETVCLGRGARLVVYMQGEYCPVICCLKSINHVWPTSGS